MAPSELDLSTLPALPAESDAEFVALGEWPPLPALSSSEYDELIQTSS